MKTPLDSCHWENMQIGLKNKKEKRNNHNGISYPSIYVPSICFLTTNDPSLIPKVKTPVSLHVVLPLNPSLSSLPLI